MSTTPKKDKKKKSKRKSSDLSPQPDQVDHSTRKKHKKDKKKKDKKKDLTFNNAEQSVNRLLSIGTSTKQNENNSPYQIKTIVGSAALLPTSLSSVSDKIRALLHTLLLRYDANLGGVLLSLQNDAKLLPLDQNGVGDRGGLIGGRIIDDLPYIHYRFQVRGLVFCPRVGMKVSFM